MTIIASPNQNQGLNLEDLRKEFYARGFSYLAQDEYSITRANRWINQGYMDICESDDWPFLSHTFTADSPWVDDAGFPLGTIEYVRDVTNDQRLTAIDVRDISDDVSLDQTGTPQFFWLDSGTINVWPVATVSLEVRYWYIPPDLAADSDYPTIPARYQYAIIEYACSRAYLDTDNPELAAICRAEGDRLVAMMRDRLMFRQHQDPEFVKVYGFSEDG